MPVKKQNQPDPCQSRKEELSSLSDAELKKRYVATFATDPVEGMTSEQMIDAIEAAAPAPPAPALPDEIVEEASRYYGNKDTKKEHPIQKDWKGKVIVHQRRVQLLNGAMVPVPNTDEIQTYDKDRYQSMVDSNFFSDSQMEVKVLHMPK